LLRDKYDTIMDLKGIRNEIGRKKVVDHKELMDIKKQLDGVVKKKP